MSKRILVVEDQPDNRQIIRDMLAPTDYEIIEADNGQEALAAIAKQRPDLILMDIQLPIMTVTKRRAASRPTLRYAQSRLSRLRLMRSAGKKKKRGQPAAMITSRNPSARVNYWPKLDNTSPKTGIDRCSDESVWHSADMRAHSTTVGPP